MRKLLFGVTFPVMLLSLFSSAFAAQEIAAQMNLLITNYRNVDSIIFVQELPNGEQNINEYSKEDIKNSLKTKIPNQRIITNYINLESTDPGSENDGNIYITTKMTNGTKIISDDIPVYLFIYGKDYVFNAGTMKFSDRKIWSRIPDIKTTIVFTAAMLFVYFIIQIFKLTVSIVLKIKPKKYVLLSFLYSAVILTAASILGLIFIPINIFLQILLVIIMLSFFEYWYINKKCELLQQKRLFLYVIISKALECAIVLFMVNTGYLL